MYAWRGVRRDVVLGALLLTAAGAVWAEDDVVVTKIRTDPVFLYDCATPMDPTKKEQHPSSYIGELPRKARVWNSEFLQVTLKNGESKCVRAYVVETRQTIPIKGECGPKEAGQNFAATRNVGEGCSRK